MKRDKFCWKIDQYRAYKFLLYLVIFVSAISTLNYTSDLIFDFPHLFNKSYLDKENYIEQRYNGYMVYRYYDWIRNTYPEISSYGILVFPDDYKRYGRRYLWGGLYEGRMNYFLYPSHLREDGAKAALFPNLTGKYLKSFNGHKYIIVNGQKYFLMATKYNAGLFRLK